MLNACRVTHVTNILSIHTSYIYLLLILTINTTVVNTVVILTVQITMRCRTQGVAAVSNLSQPQLQNTSRTISTTTIYKFFCK